MYLRLYNGLEIEIRYIALHGETHTRIVGERLTNCSLEFPLFEPNKHTPEPNARMCAKCERTIELVQSVRVAE